MDNEDICWDFRDYFQKIYIWDVAWCPKHQTAKWRSWFDGHSLTRLGSQKTWIFISLYRLQIRHSKILLILARPLPIGYFTFYYFSFFLIFNRMDAWSLMRGDVFIHFVCGSWRVNIRLGVLLLIPKSPHSRFEVTEIAWSEGCILADEIWPALKTAGMNKTSGIDDRPYEMYLKLWYMFVPLLMTVQNKWIKQGSNP